MKRITFFILSVVVTSLVSCTEVSMTKQHDGSKSMDFTKGLFVLNKVKTSLPEKKAEELGGLLFGSLINLTDSVKSISNINLPENIKSDKDFYLVPIQIIPILRQYSSADFLIHMVVEGKGDEKGGFAYGEISIWNEASVAISIYDVATGEKVYKITTIANESLSEGHSGLVITKSNDEVLKGALQYALDDLSTRAKSARKAK